MVFGYFTIADFALLTFFAFERFVFIYFMKIILFVFNVAAFNMNPEFTMVTN